MYRQAQVIDNRKKLLLGIIFCIWCNMPGSVSTIKIFASLVCACNRSLLVEPMKSARSRRFSMHSGWAITSASGYFSFSFNNASSLNVSWTMQRPGHSVSSRPLCCCTHRPRFWSGANRIGWSEGSWLTKSTALLLVQIKSLWALTAAVQLI